MQMQTRKTANLNESEGVGGRPPTNSNTILDYISARVSNKETTNSRTGDRENSHERQRAATLKKFKAAFQDEMIEAKNEGTNHALDFVGVRSGLTVDEQGTLSQHFVEELKQIGEEEMSRLEESLAKTRTVDRDIFGIKRRMCQVCAKACPGYEATRTLFSSTEDSKEFPTFCTQCACPAHFHTVEKDPHPFPEDLGTILGGQNIQSQDINFNAILLAFQVKDEASCSQNLRQISHVLEDCGLEIISSSQRYLSIEEAFLLRSLIVEQEEANLTKHMHTNFRKSSKEANIRNLGGFDPLELDELSKKNPYFLETLTRIRESHISAMRTSLAAPTIRSKSASNDQPVQSEKVLQQKNKKSESEEDKKSDFDPNASINERIVGTTGVSKKVVQIQEQIISEDDQSENRDNNSEAGSNVNNSLATKANNLQLKPALKKQSLRSKSIGDAQDFQTGKTLFFNKSAVDLGDVYMELNRQREMMPEKRTNKFKLKLGRKRTDKKKSVIAEVRNNLQVNQFQTEHLIMALESNPLLKSLCEKQVVTLTINSSKVQTIQSSLRKALRQAGIPEQELSHLYSSPNKIRALEDCINFAPQLFRLSKSIIVSEPALSFTDMLKQRGGAWGGAGYGAPSADAKLGTAHRSDYLQKQIDRAGGNTTSSANRGGAGFGFGAETQMMEKARANTMAAGGYGRPRSSTLMQHQSTTLNPFRRATVRKQTHYFDHPAVSLQRKLTTLNKSVRLTRTKTAKQQITRGVSQRCSAGKDDSPANANSNESNSKIGGGQGGENVQRKVTFKSGKTMRAIMEERDGEEDSEEDVRNADWVRAIKEREMAEVRQQSRGGTGIVSIVDNRLKFNYGVMWDFFNYSGMNVQCSLLGQDLTKPLYPKGIANGMQYSFHQMAQYPCNIFAVAKVGLASLIFPNTLDVRVSNFEEFQSYMHISDLFFPQNSRGQQTTVILRPSIVKNGLNDLFIQIYRANEFLVLKRKIRMLTKAEINHLFKVEKIPERNAALYMELMSNGPAEVVILSKIGGVSDALTVMNGANPMGRRRQNQLQEDSRSDRLNVNSVDSLFEIAPFTSFNEMIDLEDLLLRNSQLERYKNLDGGHGVGQSHQQKRTFDLVYFKKLQEIRNEVNWLQRVFNMAGYASPSVNQAQQDICIFMPKVATMQEVCLILNPIYNSEIENAIELLLRMGYLLLQHELKQLDQEQVDLLLGNKFGFDSEDGYVVMENVVETPVHILHLSRVAGDREVRELFKQSDLQTEDLYRATMIQAPFKPQHIPLLFFFMDQEDIFEHTLMLLYKPKQVQYTAVDFTNNLDNVQVQQIVQNCLLTTIGDSLKILELDSQGNVRQPSESAISGKDLTRQQTQNNGGNMASNGQSTGSIDHFEPLNTVEKLMNSQNINSSYEPQIVPQLQTLNKKMSRVAYTAESKEHGVFEVRLHRLSHTGDSHCSSDFSVKQVQVAQAMQQGKLGCTAEAKAFFERFSSLSVYYNEVNKVAFNICPAFYKFKIQPFEWLFEQEEYRSENDAIMSDISSNLSSEYEQLSLGATSSPAKRAKTGLNSTLKNPTNQQQITGGDSKSSGQKSENRRWTKACRKTSSGKRINRVYEVEEFMGNEFIEELAKLHHEHNSRIQKSLLSQPLFNLTQISREQQKSLPAYVQGNRIAHMVKSLEQVTCKGRDQLKGAGKVIYDVNSQRLRGELPRVTESSFFQFDRQKYLDCLDNFKRGWNYYLSVLETSLIETKLMKILDSLTFRYTRQPQFLIVCPERLVPTDLRLSEKIKIVNTEEKVNEMTKFFKPLAEDLIDPNREIEITNYVGSVMQTLNHRLLRQQVDKKLKKQGTSLEEILSEDSQEVNHNRPITDTADEKEKSKFSIHRDPALCGFESIGRKPRHHLIASIFWLMNFTLRKTNRRSECFTANPASYRSHESARIRAEEEYDQILDILVNSIENNYGEDEVNDALDVLALKREGFSSDFENYIREKNRQEDLQVQRQKEALEEEKRKARHGKTIEQLLEQEVYKPQDEAEKAKIKELTEFLENKASNDKDGSEFMAILQASKVRFGPYAIQYAEEYYQKQMRERKQRLNPGVQEQEKISFVKMEYFLYGVSEANRLIEQLKVMEIEINNVQAKIGEKSRELLQKVEESRLLNQAGRSDSQSMNMVIKAKLSCKKTKQELQETESKLKELRLEISSAETELLLVFHELMRCELFVQDAVFDQKLAFIHGESHSTQLEQYKIPLKTFWRPVNVNDYYETNLIDERFFQAGQIPPEQLARKKQAQQGLTETQTANFLNRSLREGSYLSVFEGKRSMKEGGQKDALQEQLMAKEAKLREKPADIKFDKYSSVAEMRFRETMVHTRDTILAKTSKADFNPQIPDYAQNLANQEVSYAAKLGQPTNNGQEGYDRGQQQNKTQESIIDFFSKLVKSKQQEPKANIVEEDLKVRFK